MSDVFFSVIIPVYNVELYLEQCIQSVLKQSYDNYEIILIDDSSDDASGEICKKYATEYEFIYCYYMLHSGAGAVRNKGLSKATGKYVLFLDSDDYWRDMRLLEILHDEIQKEYVDIVMFQMIKVTEDEKVLKRYRNKPFSREDQAYEIEDVYPSLVRDGQTLASSCNKCVSIHILREHHVEFLEGVLAEDIDWALQLFSVAKTIRLLNIKPYAYRQHKSGSASNNISGPNDQTKMIENWAYKLKHEEVPNKEAVAGFLAFEYAISMGYDQYLSLEMKSVMRNNQDLLLNGMDRKTIFIKRIHAVLGYDLTCLVIRFYLLLRRMWL